MTASIRCWPSGRRWPRPAPCWRSRRACPVAPPALRILGIDLFRAARVTPSLLPLVEGRSGEATPDQVAPTARGDVRLDALQPDALFASPAAATQLALASGATLRVQVGTREVELRLAGSVPAAGVGQVLAVMDIAAAQQTFERIGRLSRIDLRLAPGVDAGRARRALSALLPPGVSLRTPADAQSEVQSLSRAYRVNLTMLAAIALMTGGFLVFSAQWLAVVRRRQEFAFLRALGPGSRRPAARSARRGGLAGTGRRAYRRGPGPWADRPGLPADWRRPGGRVLSGSGPATPVGTRLDARLSGPGPRRGAGRGLAAGARGRAAGPRPGPAGG